MFPKPVFILAVSMVFLVMELYEQIFVIGFAQIGLPFLRATSRTK